MRIFEVGGSLRNELLGLPANDRDFAVECESFEVMKNEFLSRGGKIYLEKPQFFSLRGKLPGIGDADFTMCRREGYYSDGRHPDNVEPGTILDDLSRRDMRIGAMARNVETNEFIDPYNGRQDIRDRVIQSVGVAEQRIREDSLRLLRYLRVSIILGFSISDEIRTCLYKQEIIDLLKNTSIERIREEFLKMFQFDTLGTLKILEDFWRIRQHVFSRGLSLIPSLKR